MINKSMKSLSLLLALLIFVQSTNLEILASDLKKNNLFNDNIQISKELIENKNMDESINKVKQTEENPILEKLENIAQPSEPSSDIKIDQKEETPNKEVSSEGKESVSSDLFFIEDENAEIPFNLSINRLEEENPQYTQSSYSLPNVIISFSSNYYNELSEEEKKILLDSKDYSVDPESMGDLCDYGYTINESLVKARIMQQLRIDVSTMLEMVDRF